jgi:hypothetical protein
MREAVISTPGRIQPVAPTLSYLLSAGSIPMRTNHPSRVMPVPGLDPGIAAGIHVFLRAFI